MKKTGVRPPLIVLRFFRWYCHPKLSRYIEGDLHELYRERFEAVGRARADLLFLIDIVLLCRPATMRRVALPETLNKNAMIVNYLKVSWRNIKRNKFYSAINIGGLALGMAVAIVLGLWTYDELSFNRYFQNYDRIGHVMVHNGNGTYQSNPVPLATELQTSFDEDFQYVVLSTWTQGYAIAFGEKKFTETGNFMQPDAPEMLGLEMLEGSRSALRAPHFILIAESLSKKLFGDADPINKIVRLRNEVDVTIGGVYKDLPSNTDFRNVKFIGTWDFIVSWMPEMKEQEQRWDDNSYKIFVQLAAGADFTKVSTKIKDLKLPHLDESNRARHPELFVHPMANWHLHSKFADRIPVMSDQMEFIVFYAAIGIFVLSLACINFTNLSTARSEKRAKEVGVRKTMGSFRNQLIIQFFTESLLNVFIALVLAMLIATMVLPWFNDVAAKEISMPWHTITFWLSSIGFTLFTGILAGIYPAIYLSSFKPIKVLKGLNTGHRVFTPRKILVVLQFSISVALIIGTITVSKQIQFGKDRSPGYEREGLLSVYMSTPELLQHSEVIKNELLSSGAAIQVATSAAPITSIWSNNSGFEWKGKDPNLESNFVTNQVTSDYGKTLGWRFFQGRDFNDALASDSSAIIVNRTAVNYMGLKDPVGEIVKWNETSFLIIGVIDDIVMGSPFEDVMPTLFRRKSKNVFTFNIRLNKDISQEVAISRMSVIFQKYNPSAPFEYNFVDAEYESKFKSEMRVGSLVNVFATLAIIISGLGLYGLASYMAEQRKKELGIRKVVGASVLSLWTLLSKEFIIMVVISCTAAFPLTTYFLNSWLQRYDYRTEISWWLFPLVGIGTIILTLMIVSHQTIKAAFVNPIQSLKSE